jgi:hypothetical protein
VPNVLDATGLTLKTSAELIAYFTNAYQTIYGADVNLDQDSPDGQMMMIFVQAVLDQQDITMQIYNSFDPDNTFGVVLDQRIAINGIQRKGGTFTVTPETIVVDRALSLIGINDDPNNPYTVQDSAGTMWQLQTTQNFASAGTYIASFQAALPGAVLSLPNTITIPITQVLGVDSVNNPSSYSVLGINEETDPTVKIRRQQSTALGSQGFLSGLYAALNNINGVSFAKVYENDTGVTDGDGVPSHSIWVIIAGSAAAVDIANAIYLKRNAGCGMFGAQSYLITQADGSLFAILWDFVTPDTLYIKFTATSIDGINAPNLAAIRSGLVTSFVPGVYQTVNISALAAAVQAIDSNTLVTNAGFSTSATGPFTTTLTPSAKNLQFIVTSPNIIIIPIIELPINPTVAHGGAIQFSALGGYGAYTFTLQVNNSGGTCSTSGAYVAGGTFPVTDTVRVTDSQGNFTDTNVSVT